MSCPIISGQARRLAHQAYTRKQGTTAEFWLCSSPDLRALTRRHYAQIIKPMNRAPKSSPQRRATPQTTAPSPSRLPKLSARSIPGAPAAPAQLLFSQDDVPSLPTWESSLENLGQEHLNAVECMQGARRYVSVATKHESQWRGQLETSM